MAGPIDFIQCREKFLALIDEKTVGFYFLHPVDIGPNIAEFLVKIEEILEISDNSDFALTNRPHILWVEPCEFWRKCPMRRSLLTCLLRAGIFYEPKKHNLQESLFSCDYLKRTRKAVMRFLFGFTDYKGMEVKENSANPTLVTTGWLSVFEFKDDKFIRQTLVSSNKTSISIELNEPLWI